MTLTRRDGAYYLNLKSSGELMTSRAHGSERALATLAIAYVYAWRKGVFQWR